MYRCIVTCLLALATTHAPAATVHLFDVVGAAASAINDFEAAPDGLIGNTWAQQGIRVRQVDGEPVDIWTESGFGNGDKSWFPSAGDNGWTRITLDSGVNFGAVSFLGDSGWLSPPQSIFYELADDGVVIASGELPATFHGQWRGFSGGDFDEVRLRAHREGVAAALCDPEVFDRCNYFWVDDIKVATSRVPTPGSLALVMGAMGWMLARRKLAPRVVR